MTQYEADKSRSDKQSSRIVEELDSEIRKEIMGLREHLKCQKIRDL